MYLDQKSVWTKAGVNLKSFQSWVHLADVDKSAGREINREIFYSSPGRFQANLSSSGCCSQFIVVFPPCSLMWFLEQLGSVASHFSCCLPPLQPCSRLSVYGRQHLNLSETDWTRWMLLRLQGRRMWIERTRKRNFCVSAAKKMC